MLYGTDLHRLYWSTLGGQPPIRIEATSPPRVAWEAASLVLGADHGDHRMKTSPQRQALVQVARLHMLELDGTNALPSGRRALAETALSIRVSREWNAEQILDSILDRAWFGRGAKGFEAASRQWFGRSAAALDIHQQLALLTLARGPSYLDPVCYRERFTERYARLAETLQLDADPGAARALAGLQPTTCPP